MRRLAPGLVVLLAVVAAACGKKGPPLPPLRPLPVAPAELTARVVGGRVQLRFQVPSQSLDPDAPVAVDRVDVYGFSAASTAEPPRAADLVHRDLRVGGVAVRPLPPADAPPRPAGAPTDPRPAPGDFAEVIETLPLPWRPSPAPSTARRAVPVRRVVPVPVPPGGVVIPVERIGLPTRYYVAVAVSTRGRNGPPSAPLAVRFGASAEAPTEARLAYDQTTLTLTWRAPEGVSVAVYGVDADGREAATPVQPTPISTGSWTSPVVFGERRCFTVRAVQTVDRVSYESGAAPPVCETPSDTFPPPAPGDPIGAAESGRISIEWAAVVATDLVGYHVLRAEGAGGTLQPLTKAPEASTTWVDLTVKAGVEYTYVVVAVDRAGNVSAQSAPVRLTGR